MTRMVGRLDSSRNAARQGAGSPGWNCGRTGVPVVVTLRARRRAAAAGNPTNASSTKRARKRLARPGMVLDSGRKVLAPNFPAARMGGALVNPPMASTADGGRDLKKNRDARHDCQKLRANER